MPATPNRSLSVHKLGVIAKEKASSLFLSDASISTFACANDNTAMGVIDAALDVRPVGTSGLLVIGYDNRAAIQDWVR